MTERDTAQHIVELINALSRAPDKRAVRNLETHLPMLLMANLHIIRKALVRTDGETK